MDIVRSCWYFLFLHKLEYYLLFQRLHRTKGDDEVFLFLLCVQIEDFSLKRGHTVERLLGALFGAIFGTEFEISPH